eukprot:3716163-Amphidinium_carterae.1
MASCGKHFCPSIRTFHERHSFGPICALSGSNGVTLCVPHPDLFVAHPGPQQGSLLLLKATGRDPITPL